MKSPKKEDYIETMKFDGTEYTSLNEVEWSCALHQYNQKMNRIESFKKRRKEKSKLKHIIKLISNENQESTIHR